MGWKRSPSAFDEARLGCRPISTRRQPQPQGRFTEWVTLCGCLAREVPTQGIGQERLDLLAQHYRDEICDADIKAQDAYVLPFHDTAPEACLRQVPAK
ncbi:hypothetical protein [Mesorhizobium sp. CO1-1-8]|uniref:hypothetical protein n=1 Tax=Mesorhizobium sp. CO1-1-8 TaxID=2876631 RepID=UPI001CD05376|nr:hypothetical protein [Mesorhizobium sp. CO1-1-8]MBZ9771204.1 hypothetical protein [Mesorhizobium sp. CO1-1-8]